MNLRRLVLALAVALLCSGLLTWKISRLTTHVMATTPALPMRRIVVASKDIHAGDILTASGLVTENWPMARTLAGSFETPQQIAGRVLLVPVSSGEPVLAHDLAAAGSGSGLAASIPDGLRALSLRADESISVSGFVLPGSSVDVLVTYRSESEAAFVTSTVLQNVRVLAIGEKNEGGTDTKLRSGDPVTLLVSPEQAAKLAVASSLGKVTFSLRNGADTTLAEGVSHVSLTPAEPGRSVPSVIGASVQSRHKETAATRGFNVETLAGGKATVQSFQEEQR